MYKYITKKESDSLCLFLALSLRLNNICRIRLQVNQLQRKRNKYKRNSTTKPIVGRLKRKTETKMNNNNKKKPSCTGYIFVDFVCRACEFFGRTHMDYWRSYNNRRALNNLFKLNQVTWKMLPFHFSLRMNKISTNTIYSSEKSGIRRSVNEKFNGNCYNWTKIACFLTIITLKITVIWTWLDKKKVYGRWQIYLNATWISRESY